MTITLTPKIVKTQEFTYGYNSGFGVDEQMNGFLKRNRITRDQIIDIRYSIATDHTIGQIFQSALLIYEEEDKI